MSSLESARDLVGRFFHEPMPGIADNDALDIGGYHPALLNQEFT
jgi:hypothetical protein